MTLLGTKVEGIGSFAVPEHNKKEKTIAICGLVIATTQDISYAKTLLGGMPSKV